MHGSNPIMRGLHIRSPVYMHHLCYMCRNFPRGMLHMQKFLRVMLHMLKFPRSMLCIQWPIPSRTSYFLDTNLLGSETQLFLLSEQTAEQGHPSMNTSKLNYIVITCIMLKQNSLRTCLPIYNATSQISSVTSEGYYGAAGKYYSCHTTIHRLSL